MGKTSELDSMLAALEADSRRPTSPRLNTYQGLPKRPPSPKSYLPEPKEYLSDDENLSSRSGTLKIPKRPRKPPKLQHVLIDHRHDLVKSGPRLEDVMKAPDFPGDKGQQRRFRRKMSDYDPSALPVASDDEIDRAVPRETTGQNPRGEDSMKIKTDYGELKSKYYYHGFGLWQNTEPLTPPPPPRPISPPEVPPKAEPIMYECVVSVRNHANSLELDALRPCFDAYNKMDRRIVECGDDNGCHGDLGEVWEPFEKEDMSDMFTRAYLEKMALLNEPKKPPPKCYVCQDYIYIRVITAMSHKFHKECFVCTYCRKEFKELKFKSDEDLKPYCHPCFDKLLGHAHLEREEDVFKKIREKNLTVIGDKTHRQAVTMLIK